jgi:hypothetical protein
MQRKDEHAMPEVATPTPGWVTGTSTGILGSAFTFHVDMLQTRKQAGIPTGLLLPRNLSQLNAVTNDVFVTPFMKNYPKIAAIKIARYSLTYAVAPVYNNGLTQAGLDPQKSKLVSNMLAGATDGVASGFLGVYKQIKLTDSSNTKSLLTLLRDKNFLTSSLVASAHTAPRYGTYWPAYQWLLGKGEQLAKLDDEKNPSTKKVKQFFVGSAASILTTTALYPLDAVQKQRVQAIQQLQPGIKDPGLGAFLVSSAKKHKWQTLSKTLYPGLLWSVPLMALSGGANNLGVHLADDVYSLVRKKSR